MPIDPRAVAKMARDYTAAWNSKSAEAVASFNAADGQIFINRGNPWKGRSEGVSRLVRHPTTTPDRSRAAEANPTGARLKTARNSVSRSKRRQRRSQSIIKLR
jgi:uncharacterized protein (TIGR02246 family)